MFAMTEFIQEKCCSVVSASTRHMLIFKNLLKQVWQLFYKIEEAQTFEANHKMKCKLLHVSIHYFYMNIMSWLMEINSCNRRN